MLVDSPKAILRSAGLDWERGKLITYAVIYEKGPASWGAYVPDLPGVITVGDSREEVERLIVEAIQFHLSGMREEGLPIPAPSSFARAIEINSPA
jgi:predicted RNase H-like HicB family nuclease